MSSLVPDELKYTSTHEWVRLEENGVAYIGITDHAQNALGDLVFVELPEVGASVVAGEEASVVESVKAAADIYAPLSGEVIAINESLVEGPESIQSDPYGDGWIFAIKLSDESEIKGLLSAKDYSEQTVADNEDELLSEESSIDEIDEME